MTTSELISYIRKQINNNVPKDLIISKLVGVGWRKEDINEGFSNIESELNPRVILSDTKKGIDSINPVRKSEANTDQYREPVEVDNMVEIEETESPKVEITSKEEKKVETPIVKIPTVEIPVVNIPVAEIPIVKIPKVEVPIVEAPVVEIPKVESPKVWTPMSIPVKENVSLNTKESITEMVIQNQELPIKSEDKPDGALKGTENSDKKPNLIELKNVNKNEEFIPTLIPKVLINSFDSLKKELLPKKESGPVVFDEKSRESLIKSLPKIAMLSSYQNDLSSASKKEEEHVRQKSHKIFKWAILVLAILLVALAVWAFTSGFINIKNLNIPFIKKDPKVLLLNNSKVLSSIKSYKTETNLEISSPLFSNIALGLVSGEAVASLDKDSISINTLGVINQDEKGILSDNFVTIKSSLLQDYITTDIKNNGSDLFVSVPDLSQIIKENTPEPSIVKISEQQFNLIPPLFSIETGSTLGKMNLYKILSTGMSSFINIETLGVYDEFINSANITEKGQENIKGIDTYHYGIITDRQLAKKLLNKISENFVLNLSESDLSGLDQIIGSATVESLDVWVGKGDNNIYQYNVILSIPLSKIIGFEDKSIGDNRVSINWKTTYYDFNIPNNVVMPEVSVPALEFIKIVEESKTKNNVLSFKQLATNLFNFEKSYGTKSNSNGSCMEPVSGSLFSPTGHAKNATSAISSISEFLNKTLEATSNVGYCHSTTKAWSFTIPILVDNNSEIISIPSTPPLTPEYKYFFCIDSTGYTSELITPPTGVVCK